MYRIRDISKKSCHTRFGKPIKKTDMFFVKLSDYFGDAREEDILKAELEADPCVDILEFDPEKDKEKGIKAAKEKEIEKLKKAADKASKKASKKDDTVNLEE
jgi:hypothetical protein